MNTYRKVVPQCWSHDFKSTVTFWSLDGLEGQPANPGQKTWVTYWGGRGGAGRWYIQEPDHTELYRQNPSSSFLDKLKTMEGRLTESGEKWITIVQTGWDKSINDHFQFRMWHNRLKFSNVSWMEDTRPGQLFNEMIEGAGLIKFTSQDWKVTCLRNHFHRFPSIHSVKTSETDEKYI